MTLSIFSCSYWSSICLLWRNVKIPWGPLRTHCECPSELLNATVTFTLTESTPGATQGLLVRKAQFEAHWGQLQRLHRVPSHLSFWSTRLWEELSGRPMRYLPALRKQFFLFFKPATIFHLHITLINPEMSGLKVCFLNVVLILLLNPEIV